MNSNNVIKQLRHSSGLTQMDLVEQSGLSLRTIQRIEAGSSIPKGYTLQMLALAFDVDVEYILDRYYSTNEITPTDATSLMWINLSILAFIGIPFGNLLLPLLVWRKNRKSAAVDDIGARMISIQILWSVLLAMSLCVAPFIPTPLPMIFIVLFVMMAANIAWVFFSAYAIQRDMLTVFNFPIKLVL